MAGRDDEASWTPRRGRSHPAGMVGSPPAGSHPVRAARSRRRSEVMSGGTESSTIDAPRAAATSTPPRRLPVNTPSGMPIAVASASAEKPSSAVLPARSRMSAATGRRNRSDSPKSSRTVCFNHATYCSTSGRLMPRRSRSARRTARSVPNPSSGGARRASTSAAEDTSRIRSAANTARRSMKRAKPLCTFSLCFG